MIRPTRRGRPKVHILGDSVPEGEALPITATSEANGVAFQSATLHRRRKLAGLVSGKNSSTCHSQSLVEQTPP